MIEEKVEKWLECCKNRSDCTGCQYEFDTDAICSDINFLGGVLAYINRLKNRISELENKLAVSDRALELAVCDVEGYTNDPIYDNIVKDFAKRYINKAKQELTC